MPGTQRSSRAKTKDNPYLHYTAPVRPSEFHFILIPEPKPQLKSRRAYQEYECKRVYSRSRQLPKPQYPCRVCNGNGWYYDPNDSIDPVEGSRNRGHLPCTSCGGSGEMDARDFWAGYTAKKKQEQEVLEEAKTILKAQQAALKILSTHFTPPQLKRMGFGNPRAPYLERARIEKRRKESMPNGYR